MMFSWKAASVFNTPSNTSKLIGVKRENFKEDKKIS